MPRPLFVICAQSSAIDQNTNLLSLFQILDGYQVHIKKADAPAPTLAVGPQPHQLGFVGIAVWRRTDADSPDDSYEYEILTQSPDEDEEQIRNTGTFKFTTRHQRFQVFIHITKPWTRSGVFVFSSRIRKVGSSDWIRQDYQIPVDVTEHEGDEPESDA